MAGGRLPRPERERIVSVYMERLGRADIEGIKALFSPGGRVWSPFLGDMAAAAFFDVLGSATSRNVITPSDIFSSPQSNGACARFTYEWHVANGPVVTFDAVDVFEFEDDAPAIRRMTIVYDTHPVRAIVGDKYAAVRQPAVE